MKLVSFRVGGEGRIGILRGDRVFDLSKADPGLPRCLRGLLEMGAEGLRRAALAAEGELEALALDQVELLPPVPKPEKIICVGLNYADHAAESGMRPPREPVIFNKLPTTLRGSGDPIVLPELSQEVDYEAELVVVIGIGGRAVPRDKALAHVAGYMCGNDVSARDWQKGKPGGQWLLGKSFDSFAPIGPALVTADDIPDPQCLDIKLRLNGRVMQQSNTRLMIFSVAELIAYVSRVCTLSPGDLLFTGTPEGVGFTRRPPVFLQAGDRVEVDIERIGSLGNPVKS